jgi:hypothetical protein
MAYRLVFARNMSEGIPTPVLEAGAVRDMWAAAAALLEALEAPAWDFAQVQAAARAARVAFDAVTIELTPEGRPHACAQCIAEEAAGVDGAVDDGGLAEVAS